MAFKRLLLVGLLKYHTLEAYAVLIVMLGREEYQALTREISAEKTEVTGNDIY